MKLVRGSEVSDYMRCRKRWSWRWVEGLSPKRPNNKLFFGTAFHEFLEDYHKGFAHQIAIESMRDLFAETDTSGMPPDEVDALWDMADQIARRYVHQWWPSDLSHKPIATELKFAIPLADELYYEGMIDYIYEKDDKLWLMDHKTVKSMSQYEDNSVMDRQISRYWWAWNELADGNGLVELYAGDGTPFWHPVKETVYWPLIEGRKVHGFVYNLIRKEVPHPPNLLKKGGLSKDKSQHTTYELYKQAIEDNGLEEVNYIEMLQHLLVQENRYFKRVEVFRSPAEVESAIQEFYWTAQESLEVRERNAGAIYRNITKDCSWDCPFQQICLASIDGSNVQYLIDQFYTKASDDEVETEDE